MTALEAAARLVDDASDAVAFASGDYGIGHPGIDASAHLLSVIEDQQRAIEALLRALRESESTAVAS